MTAPPKHPATLASDPERPSSEARADGGVQLLEGAAWDELLARLGVGDWYLQRGYVGASALLEPGSRPVLAHLAGDGGDVVLPMLVRELPGGDGHDAIGAYGYGGPVAVGDQPPVDRLGEAVERLAARHGLVTSFHRFHPLLATHEHAPASWEVVEIGTTVAWRLQDERDLEASMHKHHRRVVRKARREGVEVQVRDVGALAELDDFRRLYDETMRRQEAEPFYFFEEPYWRALAEDGGGQVVLVDGMLDGELVASLLCVDDGANLHYHLGASGEAARSTGASNLCFLEGALAGRERGLEHFHLGGGVGGRVDSLHDFKRRYDPEAPQPTFAIGKAVHDPARYRELAGTDSLDGFFPAYRDPARARRDEGGHA